MKIVFVHGWGGDGAYWTPLLAELGKVDAHILDLGFTGNPTVLDVPPAPALYVTHSLGTLYALEHYADKMAGLVAINGFTCFHEVVDDEVISAMQVGLEKNTVAQMRGFYRAAEMQSPGTLHTGRLKEGLEWLVSKDMKAPLQNMKARVKALLGGQDKIVPLEAVKGQWENYEILPNGGHNLAQTHADWCARIIKDFIRTV